MLHTLDVFIHGTILETLGVSREKIQEYDILCLPANWPGAMGGSLYDEPDAIELSKRLNKAGARCGGSRELGIKTGEPDFLEFSQPVVTQLVLGVVQIVHDLAIPILAAVITKWLIKKGKDAPASANSTRCIPRVYVEIIRERGDRFDYMRLDMPADCAARVIAALPEENEGNE